MSGKFWKYLGNFLDGISSSGSPLGYRYQLVFVVMSVKIKPNTYDVNFAATGFCTSDDCKKNLESNEATYAGTRLWLS